MFSAPVRPLPAVLLTRFAILRSLSASAFATSVDDLLALLDREHEYDAVLEKASTASPGKPLPTTGTPQPARTSAAPTIAATAHWQDGRQPSRSGAVLLTDCETNFGSAQCSLFC
jgi:hypothetical protein